MICFWSQSLDTELPLGLINTSLSSPTTQSPIYFVKSHLKYLSPPTPPFISLEHFLLVFPVLNTILNNHYVLILLCKLQDGRDLFVTVAYVAPAMVPGILNE